MAGWHYPWSQNFVTIVHLLPLVKVIMYSIYPANIPSVPQSVQIFRNFEESGLALRMYEKITKNYVIVTLSRTCHAASASGPTTIQVTSNYQQHKLLEQLD